MKTYVLMILCATFTYMQAMEIQVPIEQQGNVGCLPSTTSIQLPKNLVRIDNPEACGTFQLLKNKSAFYYLYNHRIGSKLHLTQQTNVAPVNKETLDMLVKLAKNHPKLTFVIANYLEKFIFYGKSMPTISEEDFPPFLKEQSAKQEQTPESLSKKDEVIKFQESSEPTPKKEELVKPINIAQVFARYWKGKEIKKFPAFICMQKQQEIDRTEIMTEEALEQFIAKHTKKA